MLLINKFNKGFRFLLCVIVIFSKYAWVIPLKDKKGVSIVDAFQKILDDSNRKPNKIWVDKGSKFYNNSFKRYWDVFDTWWRKICCYWKVFRTLKPRIYKYMTSVSKNVYIDKLDDI